MKTYTDVINILRMNHLSVTSRLFVAVIYTSDRHEWLPVDKTEYLRQLEMIGNPDIPYCCLFEVAPDGDMFIHPRAENS